MRYLTDHMEHRVKAGAAHIAFSAPTKIAVRNFYAAALNAGGRPHGAPALRNEADGSFNAAVLDFDGNSVEVICYDESTIQLSQLGAAGSSRVLTYGGPVVEELSSNKSSCSDAVRSIAKSALARPWAGQTTSFIEEAMPEQPAKIKRTQSAPVNAVVNATITAQAGTNTNTMIGTILGAAAGVAVAYVMCKNEEDSARAENEFVRKMQAKAQRQALSRDDRQIEGTTSRISYQRANSVSSPKNSPSIQSRKMIEAPDATPYRSPTDRSVIGSVARNQKEIEYIPPSTIGAGTLSNASAFAPARSHFTGKNLHDISIVTNKKITETNSPISTVGKTVKASESPYFSASKSAVQKRDGSQTSRSKYNKTKSEQSQVSVVKSKTSASPFSSQERSIQERSRSQSSQSSQITSSNKKPKSSTSRASKAGSSAHESAFYISSDDHIQRHDTADIDDNNTITPSDSISCAPSPVQTKSSSRQRSRSKSSKLTRTTTEGSNRSKASDTATGTDGLKKKKTSKSGSASEAGSVSTVRPTKRESVVSLPVRETKEKAKAKVSGSVDGKRSVASYA